MRPKHVPAGTNTYGRVEFFLVVDADIIQELSDPEDITTPTTNPLILAVVSPIPMFKHHPDYNLISYKLPGNKLASPELIDATDIKCLIGRIQARDQLGTLLIGPR